MVSKASDDLPEPESPVITTSRSRGISRSMFLRLCSRAPLMIIRSAIRSALSRAQGTLLAPRGGPPGVLDRSHHTFRVRLARTRDVVGGAMIGRSANYRQPQRDIDGPVELQGLERYKALIV